MAESEGFEPPDLLQSTVFKTAAFDRSANSPTSQVQRDYSQVDKVLSARRKANTIKRGQPKIDSGSGGVGMGVCGSCCRW